MLAVAGLLCYHLKIKYNCVCVVDNALNSKPNYYLIDSSVLPDTIIKVVEAKKLLQSGKFKTINEATKKLGISRSAYYKYKDYVFPFHDISRERIITLSLTVLDIAGVLSAILNALTKAGANILTINQNIPINGIANITISIETGKLKCGADVLLTKLSHIEGVNDTALLASE